jgi:hypothetical protein
VKTVRSISTSAPLGAVFSKIKKGGLAELMLAPERFAAWLCERCHEDRYGHKYQYHPRSDAHSKVLAGFIWEDLRGRCRAIRSDHQAGRIDYRVNLPYRWPHTAKAKTIDLAIGRLSSTGAQLADVLVSCELKTTMTEHKKSEPRIFDELSSSYMIVHASEPEVIAAGLTVVNIADTFVSPLRQGPGPDLYVSRHRQPHVTESMIKHLRGLPIRQGTDEPGFDAYCTFVVSCDNRSPAHLWTASPAPQPGDPDHYESFLDRICQAYANRFG